ncbi:metallophosphoesterase family protein [SAR202 cluster bacterium AC-647-N09_OGT_505m]|nr:metallophosphoesterase family protein [SAR202 cluster bacterium AC-647-N09_OGT_505m]
MRIGVISDTHNPSAGKEPPQEVARAFEGVELILHAGDIYQPSCLDWLERIAPVKAVELGSLAHFNGDARVAERRVLDIEGYTIGMVHDLMLPGMEDEVTPGVIAKRFPSNVELPMSVKEFFGAPVDTVIFGHTHYAVVEEHQGILLINPGSPSLPKQIRRLGQVAILELSPGIREARIVDLAAFS